VGIESEAFREAMAAGDGGGDVTADALAAAVMKALGAITGGPPRGLLVSYAPPCTCGCGYPASVRLKIGAESMYLSDPATVDALGDALAGIRRQLWGPRA
jgi:hypothetical protein